MFKARANNRPRPEARLVQLVSLDREKTVDGSYQGVIVGKMIDGPKEGQEITITIKKTDKNIKTPKVAELSSVKEKSHTKPGGVLHFDNLLDSGDGVNFTATWVNHFSKDLEGVFPRIMTRALPVTYYNPDSRSSEPAKFDTGARRYRTEFLHTDDAKVSTSVDELRANIRAAFEGASVKVGLNTTNIMIVGVAADEDGNVKRQERIIWRGWDKAAKAPVDLDKAVESAMSNIGVENAEAAFAAGIKYDVIPVSWLETGKKTSEVVDKALDAGKGRPFVDVGAFRLPGNNSGFGFAPANVLIQHASDPDGNKVEHYMMTAKAFRAGALLPQNAMNTPSDPEAAKRHYDARKAADLAKVAPEGSDKPVNTGVATRAAAATAAPEAAKAAEKQPPVAESSMMAPAPAEEAPEPIEGLDAILDDIASADMEIA
jgi:hypothetical protein